VSAQAVSLAPAARVIKAKISPSLTGGWVTRARPEALLAEAVESRRVVVIAATAGSGKTTLVAATMQRIDRPVAWLTLDWTDAAPGRLVTYLEAALAVAVPRAEGVARDALAARIPHSEAAGLLAEAVAGERLVLVVDELERLGEETQAWAVIEALLRHAPDDMRFVLCSRRPVPASVLPRHPGQVAGVGDEVLALTVEEAASVLASQGIPGIDPVAAVDATGGWVTGVLFEAWRSRDQASGLEDPLYGYLSAHILGNLTTEDREFLIATSPLGEITAARADALGLPNAGARLASLRAARIPATWKHAGLTLRCHARFREYLQSCLESWDARRLHALRLAHGRLLAAEGHPEEATEVLLRAGAAAEALEPAATAIFGVIDRLDFLQARRWLDALAEAEPEGMTPFVLARLMLAVASENYAAGAQFADRLAARGRLTEVAASSAAAATLLCSCYQLTGRYDDMAATFALAPRDASYDALRAIVGVAGVGETPPLPELTGGPLDGLLIAIIYSRGRLSKVLADFQTVGWVQAYAQSWLITALSDAGRVPEAVDLYEAVRARGLDNTSLDAVVGPRVLTDAGRREEALEIIRRGRQRARDEGTLMYELLTGVEEARLRLRIDRDPAAALAALDPVDRHPATRLFAQLGEEVDSWYGFALLLQGRDAEALERLRRSVAADLRLDRWQDTPRTAVCLAEAEWRAGNEEAADKAADLALDAARIQGFNHILLLALRDFPAVLSRRLDAEPAADSPWHELARALHAQQVAVQAPATVSVELLEFGRCAILVEGEERTPRIVKTYLLLAYLLTRPHRPAERNELLDVLFEGRADDSARAYLRQAVRWLRTVLPPDSVVSERGAVALSGELAATSESVRLEGALAEAARLRGPDRLRATLAALEIIDRGPYLPGIASQWLDERRQRLAELATDARFEVAELAFSASSLEEAERFTQAVLHAEPFHEAAWRLMMRLASARGDDQGVLRAYQRCEQVLAEVGAEPTATTRQLVDQLRR
jgi:DNA-binding SARP family transcriptional activator